MGQRQNTSDCAIFNKIVIKPIAANMPLSGEDWWVAIKRRIMLKKPPVFSK